MPAEPKDTNRESTARTHRQRLADRYTAKLPGVLQPDALIRIITLAVIPAIIFITVFWCSFRPISDADCWFHLALGRQVRLTGAIPKTDVFSYTAPGAEWISSGWLASVVMDRLYPALGEDGTGLLLLVALVSGAAFLVVYYTGVRLLGSALGVVTAIPILLGLLPAASRFQPRPEIWSQLFLAGTCALLLLAERRREKQTTPSKFGTPELWCLPPLFALWANFHAGFAIGLLPVSLYAAQRIFRKGSASAPSAILEILPLLFCWITWLANPYTYRLVALPGKIASIPQLTLVGEWLPMFADPRRSMSAAVYLAFAALFVCSAVLLIIATIRRRIAAWHVAGIALFVLLALSQRRQTAIAAIGISALLVPAIGSLRSFTRPVWNSVVVVVLVLSGGIAVTAWRGQGVATGGLPRSGLRVDLQPLTTSDFLAANRPPGKLYNSYNFGGRLLYGIGPESKVFIDGRLDVYPHKVWLDSLAVEDGSLSIEDFCRRYDVSVFAIQIADAYGDPEHLATRLSSRPDTRLVHFDDLGGVYVRIPKADAASTQTLAYTATHGFKYVDPFHPSALFAAARNPATREAVIAEIQRSLIQSARSAAALSTAAIASAGAGEMQSAQLYLQEAQQLFPSSPVIEIAARTIGANQQQRR